MHAWWRRPADQGLGSQGPLSWLLLLKRMLWVHVLHRHIQSRGGIVVTKQTLSWLARGLVEVVVCPSRDGEGSRAKQHHWAWACRLRATVSAGSLPPCESWRDSPLLSGQPSHRRRFVRCVGMQTYVWNLTIWAKHERDKERSQSMRWQPCRLHSLLLMRLGFDLHISQITHDRVLSPSLVVNPLLNMTKLVASHSPEVRALGLNRSCFSSWLGLWLFLLPLVAWQHCRASARNVGRWCALCRAPVHRVHVDCTSPLLCWSHCAGTNLIKHTDSPRCRALIAYPGTRSIQYLHQGMDFNERQHSMCNWVHHKRAMLKKVRFWWFTRRTFVLGILIQDPSSLSKMGRSTCSYSA